MNVSRRNFLKLAISTAASIPVLAGTNFFRDNAQAEETSFAKEGVEPAKSLKYCENADGKSSACAERHSDKSKAKQYCYRCQLFQGPTADGKKAVGKCLILPGKSVKGGAWCASWVQNPNAV